MIIAAPATPGRKRLVGYNQPKSLVGFKASMSDWAALDVTAAVAWMRERYHSLPLSYVGHSFGGQALGLLANNNEVSRALLIAAQAGYWKLMASPERYRVYAMLNFVGTPLTRLLGYAPGWSGLGRGPAEGRVSAMGRLGHEQALSVRRSQADGLTNFSRFQGAMRALCLVRRSLGDAAGGRTAVLGIHLDHAGNRDHHARRRRRRQDRPFRFLPPRAPRHAVAGCRGMAAAGRIG